MSTQPYTGPVPIVTHVHGAHVGPESDGYPEAWWLPAAKNIPGNYATSGTLFDDATGTNLGNTGLADFSYPNSQPATTLWYHDHTLGMTRSNVYAGPAGFWLLRGGVNDQVDDQSTGAPWDGVLPGPAPVRNETLAQTNFPASLGGERGKYREIPIVVQDRSFNADGSLFYPADRAFFEGLNDGTLKIDTAPKTDVLPIWQPEAFFEVMVVNGVSWPSHQVAQDRYRFRMLNGCNSRFLNLALRVVTGPGADGVSGTADDVLGAEVPFYQIGAEQGFLPQVVRILTGEQVILPGDGTEPAPAPNMADPTALLMGLAERADVIVDFGGLADGTVVRMINTAPDAPFGGFPDVPADANLAGQVMEFVVDSGLNGTTGSTDGTTTAPKDLVLNAEGPLVPTPNHATRKVSLNELESHSVCVPFDPLAGEEGEYILDKQGRLRQINSVKAGPNFVADCEAAGGVPFGPTEALLGTVTGSGATATGDPLKWTDPAGVAKNITLNNGASVTVNVTENPTLNSTEDWEIYNFTADAHPIHLHLVRFEVLGRTMLDGSPSPNGNPQPWELGFKDTVLSYPGEITTIRAKFDIAGLYVWHCHIVEHEDNEMMRPFVVD
jgi:FtsP/CotA-like multicopper oxidase with cupredoxin domain